MAQVFSSELRTPAQIGGQGEISMELEKLFKISTLTHFYLGNGLHSARAIAQRLMDKHGYPWLPYNYPGHNLRVEVQSIFLGMVENRKGFVKLQLNPKDAIFYPVVSPGELVSRDGTNRSNLRPRVGHWVRFSLWHGNKAPNINQWTGEIIQLRRESGLGWYQILRDFDREIIELRKPFIYAYHKESWPDKSILGQR